RKQDGSVTHGGTPDGDLGDTTTDEPLDSLSIGKEYRSVEQVEGWQLAVFPDAVPQVHREPRIAGPDRVPPEAVLGAHLLRLLDGMHREGARAVEPCGIARACMQLEESVAVARGAMADPEALGERSGRPREVAGLYEQRIERFRVSRGQLRERGDDARRTVAPLHQQLRVLVPAA